MEEFYRHAREVHGSVENACFEATSVKVPPEFVMERMEKLKCFDAEYADGVLTLRRMVGVSGDEIAEKYYLDIWNCHGVLRCPHDHAGEEYRAVGEGRFSVPPCVRAKSDRRLADLLWDVLEDWGGAINMSGHYRFDDEHVLRFKRLMKR